MPPIHCLAVRLGPRLALPIVLLGLIMLLPGTVWAGVHTVNVSPPNGVDDTANIQAALDACAAYGKNCTVQLAAGTYFIKQLVEYNFQGTFKGKGKDTTIIQALPYLPVTLDFLQPCQPNSTTCLWPTLMIFVDGNISISDLSVHMYASEGTATAPWPRFGSTYIDTGIRLMGQYSTTNVHIDRVGMEGSPDSTSGFGFNVNNGIMYTGELSGSSANPLDSPCGAAGGFYFVSGSYTVRNSSFKSMGDGVSQDGCVRSTRVTIGGSPSTGNTFENHNTGIDLESAEHSAFDVSYNESSGMYAGMSVVPWNPVFVPSSPSRYLIHDNKFIGTAQYGDGMYLLDDPTNPWIQAAVWNNTIELQNTLMEGIGVYNTKGTAVWNNNVTSSDGYDGIGLWSTSLDTVINNNVSGFTVDRTYGLAQIYLDPSTTYDLIVCAERSDTVLNQGTNNIIIGCQQSAEAATSGTRPNLLRKKPPLR